MVNTEVLNEREGKNLLVIKKKRSSTYFFFKHCLTPIFFVNGGQLPLLPLSFPPFLWLRIDRITDYVYILS